MSLLIIQYKQLRRTLADMPSFENEKEWSVRGTGVTECSRQ